MRSWTFSCAIMEAVKFRICEDRNAEVIVKNVKMYLKIPTWEIKCILLLFKGFLHHTTQLFVLTIS